MKELGQEDDEETNQILEKIMPQVWPENINIALIKKKCETMSYQER